MELSDQYQHEGYSYFFHGDDDRLMREKLGELPEVWRDGAFHPEKIIAMGGTIATKEDVQKIISSS